MVRMGLTDSGSAFLGCSGFFRFFGKMNHGWGWEWGYVTLSEIENTKVPPFGLGLERDMYLASGATVGELTA